MAILDLFLFCSYIKNVNAEEAITFLIMELEECDYRKATGLAQATRTPLDTLYYDGWQELLNPQNVRPSIADVLPCLRSYSILFVFLSFSNKVCITCNYTVL